jgi:hypothetical protein
LASKALWLNAAAETAKGAATITASNDTFTLTAHGLSNLDEVRVESLSGGAVGVLIENAPYYIRGATANTFQLAPSPGGPVMEFASDGGASVFLSEPVYDAQDLRDGDSGLLQRGNVSGGLRSRGGVFPQGSEDAHVGVSGTTWTVGDLVGVVAASGGPYRVVHYSESNSLNPADGTNPRVDALDLQVQDDDADGSGFHRARVVYVAGTPAASPTAPTQTADSERLATILVPAGGSPAPSIQTGPKFTVARGGILPVRDSTTGRPTTGGLYKGLALFDIAAKRLDINTNAGSTWEGLASTAGYTMLTGLLARGFAHTAAEVTHNSDTLTALSGGPNVTVNIPAGITNALVMWCGRVEFTDSAETPLARWRIQMSGANTGTVGNTSTMWAVRQSTGSAGSNYQSRTAFKVQTGLSAGSTTFTSEYAISSASAKFSFRELFVVPLL